MTILTSHKNTIEYIEHCALKVVDGQLVYARKKDAKTQHFNIPYLNLAVLLLGEGTSITQQAARLCADGNLLVLFTGSGGAPVYLVGQSEYRATEHCRGWVSMFNDEQERLKVAKYFQKIRVDNVLKKWGESSDINLKPNTVCSEYLIKLNFCKNTQEILSAEGVFTKQLYSLLSKNFEVEFTRKPRTKEFANENLDAGNYLAYGFAGCALSVLGIPYAYPVIHGKTRRGALVFDVADLIKDAYILPNAFKSGILDDSSSKFRKKVLAELEADNVLENLFKILIEICSTYKTPSQ